MTTYAAQGASQMATRVGRREASAGGPVLTSNITAPAVPDWAVQRPRITKLIAEGTRWCPLTVVTGPPGAGKTMALAVWTAAERGTVAWVSLDKYDSRPGVFWSYVVAAPRSAGADLMAYHPSPATSVMKSVSARVDGRGHRDP
jgi:LuxR family maltose regulon positive regulatory protein